MPAAEFVQFVPLALAVADHHNLVLGHFEELVGAGADRTERSDPEEARDPTGAGSESPAGVRRLPSPSSAATFNVLVPLPDAAAGNP